MLKFDLNAILTALGVLVALFIGGAQVFVAWQQKNIADRQNKISLDQINIQDKQDKIQALQAEAQTVSSWLPFIKDSDPNIRLMAVLALERLNSPATVAPLIIAMTDETANIRSSAANALVNLFRQTDINYIVRYFASMLEGQNEKAKLTAYKALRGIGPKGIPQIRLALQATPPEIKRLGEKAIEGILLNEYVMNKIGIFESHELITSVPKSDIKVAIIGAGVDKSDTNIANSLVEEEIHIPDPSSPSIATTMVARLISGAQESDVVGVAPGTKLISEHSFNANGGGDISSAIKGIEHAMTSGAKIIYLQFGTSAPALESKLQDVINNAHRSGCLLIAAAGNNSTHEKIFPAAMDNVLAVAATDKDDQKADYSSYGDWVDISAPGNPISSEGNNASELSKLRGTSFSGSLVVGAAALIWSINSSLRNNDVARILMESADDIADKNPKYMGALGSGRLNVARAVTKVINEPNK